MDAREPEAVRGSGGRRRLKPPGVEGRDMGRCLDEEGKSDVEEGQMSLDHSFPLMLVSLASWLAS